MELARLSCHIGALLLLVSLIPTSKCTPAASDLDILLQNVTSASFIWQIPAMLNVYGPYAFAVLTAIPDYEKTDVPYMAAWKNDSSLGRVVVAATAELVEFAATRPDLGQLLKNSVTWAAGGKSNPLVAVSWPSSPACNYLKTAGFRCDSPYQILDNPASLDQYDVFVNVFQPMADGGLLTEKHVSVLQSFISKGKGVVIAHLGREGQFWNYTFMRHDAMLNRLMEPYGISFVGRQIDMSTWQSTVDRAVLKSVHASIAYSKIYLGVHVLGKPVESFPKELTILTAPVDSVIPIVKFWTNFSFVASEDKPLRHSMAVVLDSAVLDWKMDEFVATEIGAHASSVNFPSLGFTKFGPIANNYSATIVPHNRIPEINVNKQGTFSPCLNIDVPGLDNTLPYLAEISQGAVTDTWYSTGYYVPPGTVVTVQFPEYLNLVNVTIQIGSNTDDLFGILRDSYIRYPKVVYAKQATYQAKMASPFGGLLYIVLRAGAVMQPFEVIISGGVKVLPYVYGVTTDEEWEARRKKQVPAPWMEFIHVSGFILTLPSKTAISATAPQLKDYMSRMGQIIHNSFGLDNYAGVIPSVRWVFDKEISNGGAHAGYPIMSLEYFGDDIAQPGKFCSSGGWGWSHEIGHNMQYLPWQFVDSWEVTNNIFSLYNGMQVCGLTLRDMNQNIGVNAQAYIDDGKKWENTVWYSYALWLYPYIQLADRHGWKPFERVFAFYNELRRGKYPTKTPETLQERTDLAVIVWSKILQENMTAFFRSYGITVSDSAASCVANLPSSNLKLEDILTGWG